MSQPRNEQKADSKSGMCSVSSSTLKIETTYSSEASVASQSVIRLYNPEEGTLQSSIQFVVFCRRLDDFFLREK
jgi:hypothetical protein